MSSQLNNPACKIYVGNLGPAVSAAELQMLFSKFGSVRWADIATEAGGTASKGFGFVMMASEPEARKAVIGLDGTRQFGVMLKVSVAGKPNAKGPARPRPRDGRPGGERRYRRGTRR